MHCTFKFVQMMYQYCLTYSLSSLIHFSLKEETPDEYRISFGILFQITGSEQETLSLYI